MRYYIPYLIPAIVFYICLFSVGSAHSYWVSSQPWPDPSGTLESGNGVEFYLSDGVISRGWADSDYRYAKSLFLSIYWCEGDMEIDRMGMTDVNSWAKSQYEEAMTYPVGDCSNTDEPCSGEIPIDDVDSDGDGVLDTCDVAPDDNSVGAWIYLSETITDPSTGEIKFASFRYTETLYINNPYGSVTYGDSTYEGSHTIYDGTDSVSYAVPTGEQCGDCTDPDPGLPAMSEDPSIPDDKECQDAASDCFEICSDRGGVSSYNCFNDADGNPVSDECVCKDEFALGDSTPEESDIKNNTEPSDTNGTQVSDGNDTDSDSFKKMVDNTADLSENVGKMNDNLIESQSSIDNTLKEMMSQQEDIRQEELTQDVTAADAVSEDMGEIKDTIKEGYELQGNGLEDVTYQDGNYTSGFTQPTEESLGDSIGTYITNGLPFSDTIENSGISVGTVSPSLTATVWGKDIDFSISEYKDTLNIMGNVLIVLATISGFMIIIGRK